MHLPEGTLTKLPLSVVAPDVLTGHLDRFPSLVMDRCLSDATSKVVEGVVVAVRAGRPFDVFETITMPRRRFGPRPVTLTPPSTRILYAALVQALTPDLPQESRAEGAWERHQSFGLSDVEADVSYVVETDIAACYEYIEHPQLRAAVLSRSAQVPAIECLVGLLGEMTGRARGLPQLTRASDVLADTYLLLLEQELLRNGWRVSRYADDFRIVASDWGLATEAIEVAAEAARGLGLVLSSEKTQIHRASTLLDRERQEAEFLLGYFDAAESDLTQIDFWGSGYDTEAVEVPPEQEETLRLAMANLVNDWWLGRATEDVSMHAHLLPLALTRLAADENRLSDDVLTDIAFHHPLRVESISSYLLQRSEPDANWASLKALVEMPRQSPWAKLWLLSVATQQQGAMTADGERVCDWAERQLDDKHEVVRAEAAFFLAGRRPPDETVLGGLFGRATSMTRPALAAAAGRAGLADGSPLVKAMIQGGRLAAPALTWGRNSP
jgi:hypothetical protein